LSVHLSAWNNSAPTGRIFIKLNIWVFFLNLSRNYKFHYNRTDYRLLHVKINNICIISRSVPLRMRNVSDKSCRENQKKHFVFSKTFLKKNRAIYEIIWKNIQRDHRWQYGACALHAGKLMTHTHTHTDTHTHAPHARRLAHAHTHTHTPARRHTRTLAHTHTHARTHTRRHTRKHTRTRTHARTRADTHTHTRAHIRTQTHTQNM
jgi:hypothetical protein